MNTISGRAAYQARRHRDNTRQYPFPLLRPGKPLPGRKHIRTRRTFQCRTAGNVEEPASIRGGAFTVSLRNIQPEYTITTLQLDSPDYALHYAKEREAVNRFKLRVRTYGEIGCAPVFVEVKAKLESMIVKTRVAIPFGVWGRELISGVRMPRCFKSARQENDFLQFKRLVWEIGAEPVALVRYVRESYVGTVDRYARVTFDRKLQYQMTDSWTDFGRGGTWHGMDSTEAQGFGLPYSGVVLEVKTLSHTPVWVMDLVERFQLKKQGNCKYSTAVWREGLFRGYPESNSAVLEAMCEV